MENLPYLMEHQAPVKETVGANEVPDAEQKACKLVDNLLEKAKRKRDNIDVKWLDYYRMFRGDQWKKKRAKYRHMEVFNFIFQMIQSQVPIMTDARPKPTFTPQNPDDIEVASILNDLFESDWQRGKWLYKLSHVLFDGHIIGTGLSNLKFDPEMDAGLGRMDYLPEDPVNCYPDQEATDINSTDCDYIIICKPRDIDKVKAQYGGHKYVEDLKPDLIDLAQKNKTTADRANYQKLTNYDMPKEGFSYSSEYMTDQVMVTTLYMRPRDTQEIQEEKINEQGETEISYITKKRYPQGRKIVKINNHIMEDGPLDNEDLKFPYQKYVNYIDPREFWGISEIEPVESPQLMFNKLISFVMDVLTLMGNPIWLIPNSTGLKPGTFNNAPGLQIPFDGPTPPNRVEGVQLQPYILSLIDKVENWFNSISGSQDITRGINAPGVTAASAIESLQSAAQTRIREKMRHMDAYLTELGEQYATLVFQHYTIPRIFRLTSKDGLDKFFKFHVEHVKDELGNQAIDSRGNPVRKINVQQYEKNEETGQMEASGELQQYILQGSFDVKVGTSSGLPFAKAEKEQRLLQYFDRGIIDIEEILKQSDYPNYEAVLARVKAQQEQAAMQAQQQPQK